MASLKVSCADIERAVRARNMLLADVGVILSLLHGSVGLKQRFSRRYLACRRRQEHRCCS